MKKIKKAILVTLIAALCSAFTFAEDAASSTSDWAALQALFNGVKGEYEDEEITITLSKNYTAGSDDAGLEIPWGKTVTLDLNGHTIDRGLAGSEDPVRDGYVIKFETGASLIINDSSTDKSGKITGGNNDNYGGGIFVGSGGNLTLNAGSICGNKADRGGGVCFYEHSFFTMNGGSIENNQANNGGGVAGLASAGAPVIKISGGIIRGNTSGNGGGIFSQADVLEITGGEISGNNAYTGGGIYQYGYSYNENNILKISGSPVIKNNVSGGTLNNGVYTGGTPNNVYLYTNPEYNIERIMTVTGALSETAEIYVSPHHSYQVIASGLSNGGQNAISHFYSDDLQYNIYTNSEGDAYLFKGVVLTATEDPYNPGTYYTTYGSINDIKYQADSDCEVYYATGIENGILKLEKVDNRIIISCEPVIIKSSKAQIVLTPSDDTVTDYDSELITNYSKRTVTSGNGDTYYVLTVGENGLRFYKYSGELEANKAFYFTTTSGKSGR